ncbi:MAG: hypothetical protein ABIQ86_05520 [Steroidobacteraceae bacterium]
MSKPTILFFARGYQAGFFPELQSEKYQSVFATLTSAERRVVERKGGRVVGCFEEEFERIKPASVRPDYLVTSLMSDRFLGRFSRAERMEILGKEIAFWRRILESCSPVAVVNELVAIEISEVLLIEARLRGVRYLAGLNCLVDDYFYWLGNPLSLSGEHLEMPDPGKDARARAQSYARELLTNDYRPFYVKNLRGRLSPFVLGVSLAKLLYWKLNRLWSALSGRFLYEIYDDEYAKKVVVYLKGLVLRYDSLEDVPADAEVVFYPLHQEPEATLNYMSEFYSNQVSTIENILKCLTPVQVLVVKEHPVDKGSLLQRKFRDLRAACSGLYFLPAEVHGREVLARAHRVVTLTSTVGWEAVVMGREVLVLGTIFYDRFDGARFVNDFKALRRELRRPAMSSPPRIEAVEQFVASMAQQSWPGNPFPHGGLYTPLNRQRVIDAIVHGAGL